MSIARWTNNAFYEHWFHVLFDNASKCLICNSNHNNEVKTTYWYQFPFVCEEQMFHNNILFGRLRWAFKTVGLFLNNFMYSCYCVVQVWHKSLLLEKNHSKTILIPRMSHLLLTYSIAIGITPAVASWESKYVNDTKILSSNKQQRRITTLLII